MPDKDRLPPGQTPTSGFPTLHYGPIPAFDPSTWDFRIWGAVEKPIEWTWDQVLDLPRVKIRLDLHCVTTWSKFDTEWEGISPKMLVEEGLITPTSAARFVMQHAEHGYTTNLPLDVFLQDNFL
ncbi:MAG: molybdopterin-dependent oxidoreductase, partial [Brevefilum sp.]|nr:molybdopterin-dependent oxidoreductase [Brevefilum sp.]